MSTPDTPPGFFSKIFKRPEQDDSLTPQSDAALQSVASQKRMMSAAERFHLLRVDDVMVPRADIIAVDKTTGLADLSDAFKSAGHSRLPVYNETLDNPVGMVHIKDLLPYLMLNAKGRLGKTYPTKRVLQYLRRDVLFVPPSMLAQDLLRRMQARRTHMAIVVDEYGGTDGLVTIEDLIEPIVGDIDDEHDAVEAEVQIVTGKNGRSVWEADARTSIDDFEKAVGRDFATPEQEEDADTLGGLVFTLAGRVPERGEIIRHESGFEFEVMDADPRRVKRLRVSESGRRKAVIAASEMPPEDPKTDSATSEDTSQNHVG